MPHPPGKSGPRSDLQVPPDLRLDLSPARWIWFPSRRTLPNTVVLFRKTVTLSGGLTSARGWIGADSRYRLTVNGRRVQFGPAPCDPRHMEADPLDLRDYLVTGENVIAVEVLFYGTGDGTWTFGKPGLIFSLDLIGNGENKQTIVSDSSWAVQAPRAWRPGQYRRWYLRAFQEEFDSRYYPHGWTTKGFTCGPDWFPAMQLECPANTPSICARFSEYQADIWRAPSETYLLRRSIPMLRETEMTAPELVEALWLRWKRSPVEYFEFDAPDSWLVEPAPLPAQNKHGERGITLHPERGTVLTFRLNEQGVGWPHFTIDAPAGTIVELLVHEAHALGGPPLLNTHFHSWSRFVCREGLNNFEPFDFESCRWIQLHIHPGKGKAVLRSIGLRRRVFPFLHEPRIAVDDPALQRLMEACCNTLLNSAQETVVDGMARERQQYSGDGGHQLHPLYVTFGDDRLPDRYIRTFGQGMTHEGYFLDCWPAYDRLARLAQRQLGLSVWGPLIDHGVGFVWDCWHHVMHTGSLDAVRLVLPNLQRFVGYLTGLRDDRGLIPVEGLGVPSVYIDHSAYLKQRHKSCAFNLYISSMLEIAFVDICNWVQEKEFTGSAKQIGRDIRKATQEIFWDATKQLFVVNKPWLSEEGTPRFCDRSLSNALLYDQLPGGSWQESVRVLSSCPAEMGFSYPANAIWRLWALARAGKGKEIIEDLRGRWAGMPSVVENNTLSEFWDVTPDSGSQWSHCSVGPLVILYQGLLGLRPLSPAYETYEIRPLITTMRKVSCTAHIPPGELNLTWDASNREFVVATPPAGKGVLSLSGPRRTDLQPIGSPDHFGFQQYSLAPGARTVVQL